MRDTNSSIGHRLLATPAAIAGVLRSILWMPAVLIYGVVGMAYAKLPPSPPVDPEKAAEAAKKTRELEEKYMDRTVERYKKGKGVKAAAATGSD